MKVHKFAFIFAILLIVGSKSVLAQTAKIYGNLSLYYEKVWAMSDAPAGDKGPPGEFDYAHLHIMMQSDITDKVRAYINLEGTNNIEVRNYWGEYIFSNWLRLRVGKIYKPFGQFNEILDAHHTYLGMEPPELFDKDHLMLPKTGKIMVHGGASINNNFLTYSYMLDSDEKMLSSNNEEKTLSHSWDLNYSIMNDSITIGHSGFLANEANGSATPLGTGPPNTGVLPWMSSDKYNVLGAYFSANVGAFTIKGAYWNAHHNAIRDANAVAAIYSNTTLNPAQIENFYGKNYMSNGCADDVLSVANFNVSAFYLRIGYKIQKGKIPLINSEVTPYIFLDSYSNPETIASKDWGGDNEAGIADDGKFYKPTIGVSIRPNDYLALKLDGSAHIQKIGGQWVNYKEFRIDLSFVF